MRQSVSLPARQPHSDWTVIIPVKDSAAAKSRLALPSEIRRTLADAFLRDVVTAWHEAGVAEVRVLGGGHRPGLPRHATVADDGGVPLNAALRSALATISTNYVVCSVADLPCLTPPVAEDLLRRARHHMTQGGWGFVPDEGGGTTMLLGEPALLRPGFGTGSATRHRHAGARDLVADRRARLDVDTLPDLRAAVALGVGTATQQALAAQGCVHRSGVH